MIDYHQVLLKNFSMDGVEIDDAIELSICDGSVYILAIQGRAITEKPVSCDYKFNFENKKGLYIGCFELCEDAANPSATTYRVWRAGDVIYSKADSEFAACEQLVKSWHRYCMPSQWIGNHFYYIGNTGNDDEV